jgi:DNA primase
MSAIDEIKQKLDIAEVIGQYAALKKAGRNLTALCPFHSEKHPSFFVYPEQQSWHCFGACNTGGDVFAFIMKKEGLTFGEALRLLANRAGVILPERPGLAEAKEEKEPFFSVNDAAALYYHNLLLNSPAAARAKDYVVKRGLTLRTIADFQLGFSPDSRDALKSYLKEKGHREEVLVTAGLLYRDEQGRSSDRFRGKLMIPIRDIKGRVTGFGARVLDDSEPKYKNSPQSPTFDKSATLYGIDRAATAIRKQDRAIIMEGYMDVIMAHQCGVANAVASMGTAITGAQVNILKKLSKNLILSLDADAAGEEAMLRTVDYENILNAEMRVIVLPEGKDPDEVIKEDPGLWQGFVDKAVPLVDFLFEKTTAGLDLSTARDKSGAVDRLLPVVAAISDPVRQAHYLQKLAGLVKVDLNTIKASMSRLKPAPGRRPARRERPTVQIDVRRKPSSASREEYLLALLFQNIGLDKELQGLSPDCFENTENRVIYNAWREAGDTVLLKERVDPAIREHLEAIINKNLPGAANNVEKRFIDCVCELKKTYLKNLAARVAETGEIRIEIPEQLKELDARKSQKRNPSYKERIRR